jgi:hypothetical protein
MRKLTLIIVSILLVCTSMAQDKTTTISMTTAPTAKKMNIYWSFSTEMIFSFAAVDSAGNTNGNIMRWAPVFNPQAMVNFDFNKHVGLFTGLAIRNVGFIYKKPSSDYAVKSKYRTYNLGIPIGFKAGKMNSFLFFGGYEIEFPFVYKEKTFVNDVKLDNKIYEWFSDRVEPIQHSFMAGVQFPFGATVKFKYYLTNFLNKNYVESGTDGYKPYNFDANVFYFSLAWNLFANWRDYDPKYMKSHK